MQNYAFVHKRKCCPDLPPRSRITSALPYAHHKWMILFSLTGLSTEDGHPYLLLSMLYTVIGCKPEMHVFKKKIRPWQIDSVRRWQPQLQVCGEPAAYPQGRMCTNPFCKTSEISIHLCCTTITMVLQPVDDHVNR